MWKPDVFYIFLPWWWHDRVLHEVDIIVLVVLRWRRAVFSIEGKPPENFLQNQPALAGKIVCGITSNEWRNRWVVVNLILYLKPLYCHNNFAALNIATWRPGGQFFRKAACWDDGILGLLISKGNFGKKDQIYLHFLGWNLITSKTCRLKVKVDVNFQLLAIPNIFFGIVGFIKGPYKPRSKTFSTEVEVSISKARYVSSEKNEGGFWGTVLESMKSNLKSGFWWSNQGFMLHGIQFFVGWLMWSVPLSPWPGANSCGLWNQRHRRRAVVFSFFAT